MHFVDRLGDGRVLCGDEGPGDYDSSKVDCRECLELLRRRRRDRIRAEQVQQEINSIMTKRKRRLAARLLRAQNRRT